LLPSDSVESFDSPHALPGDRGILFSIRRESVNRLAVLDLKNRRVTRLEISGTDPRYVANGHLVYVGSDGRIRAVTFNPETFETSGDPVVVTDGVRIVEGGRAMMAVSRTGLIVGADSAVANRILELVDRGGRGERLTPRVAEFQDPRFSPDGKRIAVRLGSNIWVLDRLGGALVRLSADSAVLRPVWSPDGRAVTYVRQVGATVELRRVRSDGSAPAESLLTTSGYSLWEVVYTPDGRFLIVRTTGGPTSRDLWLVGLDSTRALSALLRTSADEVSPSVSPDGRWLAYASNESGRYEVYVRPFPGMGARYPVSLDGGTVPLWSPRGNELFYRNGPAMISATVRTSPQFEVVDRRVLFTNGDYVSDPTTRATTWLPTGSILRWFVT
jgi:serine/threonine-protein kinase